MKRILFRVAAFLLLTVFNSCKKNDYPPFYKENCRVLSTAVSGMSNYSTVYTYDANGFISSESTNMGKDVFEYRYSRKRDGKIETVQKIITGEQTTIKYSYEGEKVVKLQEFVDIHLKHISNIKYNAEGLISEITNEYIDYPQLNGKSLFEYNELGQYAKITNTDLKGKIQNLEIHKNTGSSSPSSEQYLMSHGLPFQILYQYAYAISDPGIGSTIEAYSVDQNGKMILQTILTMISKKLNTRGYTESISYVNDKGHNVSGALYEFDCSKEN